MLEHLFGSQTRVLLLRLFLLNPGDSYFVREISRKVKKQLNAVRRELANLEANGMVLSEKQEDKKFFRANTEYYLYSELKSLLLKSQMSIERSLVKSMKELGSVQVLMLTGMFVERPTDAVDLLIVGRINRKRLQILLAEFQGQFSREINYTIMTPEEFQYRKDVTDKFLVELLNQPKITLIDRTESKEAVPA